LIRLRKKMSGYLEVTYNQESKPYTDYPSRLSSYLFRRFKIKNGARVLDLGCGRGDFSRAFKELGLEVCGLDREESASSNLEGIDVKYCDIEKGAFPYAEGFFDLVFTKSVIEHLFEPDLFIRSCMRVLKPGGRIIILTPDWVSQRTVFFDDHTHRHPYSLASVESILNVYGFKDVGSELFYQLPVLWRQPFLRFLSSPLRILLPTRTARKITQKTGIGFFRWSVELMVLGTGVKDGA